MRSTNYFFTILSVSTLTIFVYLILFRNEAVNLKKYNVQLTKEKNNGNIYENDLDKPSQLSATKSSNFSFITTTLKTSTHSISTTTNLPVTPAAQQITTVQPKSTTISPNITSIKPTIKDTPAVTNPPLTTVSPSTSATVTTTKKPTVFDCHKNPDNVPTLPNILSLQPKVDKSIFFLETSCRTKVQGKVILSVRQACGIESAAITNPNYDVFLLVANPGVVKNTDDLNDKIVNALLSYKNLKISHVNIDTYFVGTPVEQLYNSHLMENSSAPVQHLSDVMRFVTMWRYGAIYLDLDVLVLKSFEDLPPNFTGVEFTGSLGAGVMNFNYNGVGHNWTEEILKDINKDFRPKSWSYNANGALVRFLRKLCNTTKIEQMTPERCKGYNIYPREVFYPLLPWDWKNFFNKSSLTKMLPILTNARTVHMWNTFSVQGKIIKGENAAYEVVAMEYCPKVYSQIKSNSVFK